MAHLVFRSTCSFLINIVIISSLLIDHLCQGFNPKLFNVSVLADSGWSQAGATWYGGPDGAGSDGGACGYKDAVERAPFSRLVTAGGPSLYQSGKGCGACYQVKCTSNAACSGNPVTVVMTDECPGCVSENYHFDLSGTAFGSLARPGQAEQLRNAGILQIQFRKVECDYPSKAVTFKIDEGSNANYFAVVIEYGDGDIRSAELQDAGGYGTWRPMERSWGAVWKLDSPSPLRPPISLRLTSQESGRVLVARGVIPAGWQPGQIFKSLAKFEG